MFSMKQYADIFAFDRDGQLVLIAEAKSKRGTSINWAAKMRRNMFAHGLMPNAPYFLLALPDAAFTGNECEQSRLVFNGLADCY